MERLTGTKLWKYHKGDFVVLTIAALVAGMVGGLAAGITTFVVLYIVEVVFSFDNAIVNAEILARIKGRDDDHTSKLRRKARWIAWVVAVLGMRLFFPVAMVVVTAKLSFGQTLNLALFHGAAYKNAVDGASLPIAMIGGTMLISIFLLFLFDDREQHEMWITFIEKPLARVGKNDVLVLAIIVATTDVLVAAGKHMSSLLYYGLPALSVYAAISILSAKLEDNAESGTLVKAGASFLRTFIRLVAILSATDASLSLDSVQGGLSVTHNIIVLMLGLGAGSWTVMSLTIRFVEEKSAESLKYLGHGAYYAIGGLGILTYVKMFDDHLNDYIGAGIGLFFIFAGVGSSLAEKKREARKAEAKKLAANGSDELTASDDDAIAVAAQQ